MGDTLPSAMQDADLSDDDRRVLRAIGAIEDDREVQTIHAIALRLRHGYDPVQRRVNSLFTGGFVTPDLRLTDRGRKASSE